MYSFFETLLFTLSLLTFKTMASPLHRLQPIFLPREIYGVSNYTPGVKCRLLIWSFDVFIHGTVEHWRSVHYCFSSLFQELILLWLSWLLYKWYTESLLIVKMVDTLSNLVCLFVIKNIFNVESLVGLPDLIGERLFELLLQNYFTETLTREKLIHGLYIFCAAYGHLVLTSVNLSNLLIMINEYTECFIPLLTNITSLNLSHCHFGVDHEIINHISHLRRYVSVKFYKTSCVYKKTNVEHDTICQKIMLHFFFSLKVLCLSDCDVTDNVLQKLTIPCRLYKNGFSNLQELDLSCMSLLRYLMCRYISVITVYSTYF